MSISYNMHATAAANCLHFLFDMFCLEHFISSFRIMVIEDIHIYAHTLTPMNKCTQTLPHEQLYGRV
jgi:hypothetical protein